MGGTWLAGSGPSGPGRWGFAGGLATALLLSSAARVVALDPSRAPTQYVTDTWTQDQGLPQNSVAALLQDREGYLWLATQEGLVRFDGVRFVVFDSANTPVFASSIVKALAEDRDGRLWIGTADGLVLREGGRFLAGPRLEGADRGISTLCGTPDGSVWIGTSSKLLNLHEGRLTVDPNVPGPVNALFVDRGGALWIGTPSLLIRRDAEGERRFPQARLLDGVRAFADSRDGGVWIGGAKGVLRYSNGFLPDTAAGLVVTDHAWALREDRDGNLWVVAYDRGVTRWRDGQVTHLTSKEGFPDDFGRSLIEDREGNLWIGTESAGLTRLKDGDVATYGKPEGLPLEVALNIFEAPDGTLWFSTAGGGAQGIRKDGRRILLSSRNGLPSDVVMAFAAGREGSLWIGTNGGLVQLKDGRLRTYAIRDGLRSRLVTGIAEGPEGGLWISTQEGLAVMRNGHFTVYGRADGLWSNSIRAVHPDRQGRVWVLCNDGLDLWENGRFAHATVARDLGPAAAFLEDSRGAIWIGGALGGLLRIEKDKTTLYKPRDGLLQGAIHRVLEDDAGDLWLSSNKGLFRFRRSDLDAFAAGRASSITSRHFGRADGMRSVDCYGGFQNAGTKTRDGRLWFPTVKGAVVVDPARLRPPAEAPQVVVESLLAGGMPLAGGDPPALPPGPRQLQVEYTALSLTAPEKVQFRYRLEGGRGTDDWIEAGTRRVAYYTNLRPDRYTFSVAARIEGGAWGEAAEQAFRVTPRFSETRAFLALFALTGLGLLAGGHRWRTSHLRARQSELEDLVRERTLDLKAAHERAEEASRAKSAFVSSMSHELRTPLSAVLGFAHLLERRPGRDSQDLEHLAVIHRSGEHLLGLINNVLSLAKIEAGRASLETVDFDLKEVVSALEALFRGQAVEKNLAFTVETSNPPLPRRVSGDEGKLRQILINLLGNAFKFTDAGAVTLRVAWKDGRGVFDVSDTGTGLTPEEAARLFSPFSQTTAGSRKSGTGLGLALSRSLAQLMGGDVRLSATPGRSSSFRVDVPLPEGRATAEAGPHERGRVRGLAPGQRHPLILVADDNTEGRTLLTSLLGQVGFELLTAADGREAFKVWQERRPDLIWMDMNMPVMDGLEATRSIRAEERAQDRPHTPIIALSASALEHERDAILAAGCDDFLAKPFRPAALFAQMADRLGVVYVHDRETAQEVPPPEQPLTRERLRALPAEWRRRLRESLAGGDLVEAARLTAEVESNDAGAASALRRLIRHYQLDEIEDLLSEAAGLH